MIKNKWFKYSLLILIIGFGLFFRVYHLNDQSLWLDEGITYYNSGGENPAEVWDKAATLDQSPPGYYLLMHGYLDIFGENEIGFRLISVLFGALSILFLYLLIAEIFNSEAGLFAAFLLAINSFHIGFSMEARMYTLLSLETLMALYFLFKAMREKKKLKYLYFGTFSLSCVFGLYTHNYFIFILPVLTISFLMLLLLEKKKLEKFILGVLSAIVAIALYLPWLPSAINQFKTQRYWIAPNTIADLQNYLLDFADQNIYLYSGIIILGILGLMGTILAYKKNINYKRQIVGILSLAIFLLIGMGAPLLYSLNIESILKIRYVVYLVPILMGLAALGIYAVRRLSLILAVELLLVALILSAPWNASAYPMEIGEDYRQLVSVINDNPAPVVVHSPSLAHVMGFYNSQRQFRIYPFPKTDDLNKFNIDLTSKDDFIALIGHFDYFYLVISHSHETPGGILALWSRTRCAHADKMKVDSISDVYYFSECLVE